MWRIKLVFNSTPAILLFVLLGIYTTWWLLLPESTSETIASTTIWWGATYQVIALVGAVYGFFIFSKWGGVKSYLGRALLSFSLGLLLQVIGQSIATWYVLKGQGVPYPSLSDIGFFGSIFFYAYGALLLCKVSGGNVSFRNFYTKLQVGIVPLSMLTLSSLIFLRGYQFDWSNPLVILLDLGYPLGQAFYVSIAIVAFLIARQTLGGVMRIPVFFFIGALVMQYLSDFMFLYKSYHGTYVPGGNTDFLYLLSYFLMSLSIVQLSSVYRWIKET